MPKLKSSQYQLQRSKERYLILKGSIKGYLHLRFLDYKGHAKRKDIAFELSEEQFDKFYRKDCFYCGSLIPLIGIDRMENDKGYEIGNVVSCCRFCNMMKKDFPKDIFIEQCKRIATFNI
jgi:hypothetical protein